MRIRIRPALLLLALALGSLPRALAVSPAPAGAGRMPDVPVWNEANTPSTLYAQLNAAGSGPVVVLPVYTRCTMSCPVLAARLVREAAPIAPSTPFRVVLFSFDAGEDSASLTQFRHQQGLPANWLLLRSDPAGIRRFCDFFHYSVLTEGAVMIHLNQMFLLDHTLRWRATFIDQDWDQATLRKWMGRAESPGLLGWIAMNPAGVAIIGFGGLLLSLGVILAVLLRPRAPEPAPLSASPPPA